MRLFPIAFTALFAPGPQSQPRRNALYRQPQPRPHFPQPPGPSRVRSPAMFTGRTLPGSVHGARLVCSHFCLAFLTTQATSNLLGLI